MDSTDWKNCHAHPFPLSRFTRSVTRTHLVRALKQCGFPKGKRILELGGGASSFQEELRSVFKPVSYTAADNCLAALEQVPAPCRRLHCDLLSAPQDLPTAELVFSVGLIEHFTREETSRLVQLHLKLTEPGGLAVLLFPTPSILYRCTRFAAEITGLWRYPDERPLNTDEVITAAGNSPVYSEFIRANILTQHLLVFRRQAL